MKIRTSFNQFTVEHEGARFTFKPLRLSARLDIESVMGELVAVGERGGIADLSREARHQIHRTLVDHLITWEGVEDERGRTIEFEPELVDGLPPVSAIGIFFKLYHESYVSETERKNSSSESSSGKPAPDSIAPGASLEGSSHAESLASSNIETAAVS